MKYTFFSKLHLKKVLLKMITSDLKFEPLFIVIDNISAGQKKYLKKQRPRIFQK